MTETGGVIEGDGIRIESSEETAEQMIAAVTPKKDEPTKFKAVTEGEKPEKEKTGIQKAASDLGKRGGKAAAKARAEKGEEKETEEPTEETAERRRGPASEPEEEEEGADGYATPELKAKAKERVEQATRKEAEAKKEAARLRAENEELRKARQAPPAPEQRQERPEAPKAPQKPKADDFENYEDYLDARDAHNRQVWEAEHAQREHAKAEREQVIGTVKTYQEAIAETIAEDPEFWDKVPEIHAETPLGQEIVRAGAKAPGILLHLAEHPKVYDRLSKTSDLREVIREVGKIEARLEDATGGNPSSDERPGPNPEISRARPPARPPRSEPNIASGDDASKEPDENAPLSAFRAADRKLRAVSSGR